MKPSTGRPMVLVAFPLFVALLAALGGMARASDRGGAAAGAGGGCVDTRRSAPLRRNLLVAIRSELARRGGRQLADLRESDLLLQNCIRIDDPGAPLVVKSLAYDPIRGVTEALISASGDALALPVLVAVNYRCPRQVLVARREIRSGERLFEGDVEPVTIDSSDLLTPPITPEAIAGSVVLRRLRTGQIVSRSMLQVPLMVRAWKPAIFTAETKTFRTQRTVIPLRSGVMGAQIKVRDPKTEQVLVGMVVGPDLLKNVD